MSDADITTNPLLDFSGLPRFAGIRPEHVGPVLDHIRAEDRAARECLLSADTRYSWESFVEPLQDTHERLSRMWSPVSHPNAVRNEETLRTADNDALLRISAYRTEVARTFSKFKEESVFDRAWT